MRAIVKRSLCAIAAIPALVVVGLPDAASASEVNFTSVPADGVFTFHACADPADFCLSDQLTASVPGIGAVTGTFEVVIDGDATAPDGCAPIHKSGEFTTSVGRVNVRGEGAICGSIASYTFTVDGGTGHFRHAHGAGQWLVPPATTFTGSGGTGPEFLSGRLSLG